jgi:hypothetical protein
LQAGIAILGKGGYGALCKRFKIEKPRYIPASHPIIFKLNREIFWFPIHRKKDVITFPHVQIWAIIPPESGSTSPSKNGFRSAG